MKTNKLKWSCIAVIILGLIIKILLLNYQYGDYRYYLSLWVEYIKTNGYFHSLKDAFHNYTPTYIYALVLIAKLDLYPLYAIKFLSIAFDYIIAYFVGQMAFMVTKKENIKWIAFAVIPIIPTVVLNGALMSQCDAIYATFAIGSAYFLLKNKLVTSMIFLGLAFSLKAQAAMVLPFFFVFMLRGGIRWYYFLIIPLVYVITILPVWIMGRPLTDLLLIYQMQSNYEYSNVLVSYFPNIYHWLTDELLNHNKIYGIVSMAGITLLFGYILSSKKYNFSTEAWIKLLFISAIVCPFILPGMHERYMYIGDVLAGLYILLFTRKFYLALGILFVSFYSYIRCLYAVSFIYETPPNPETVFSFFQFLPWKVVSLIYLALIVLIIMDFIKTIKSKGIESKTESDIRKSLNQI